MITKSLGLQSIKQIARNNTRQITAAHNTELIKFNRTVNKTCITPSCDNQGIFRRADTGQRSGNCRSFHTHHLLCNEQDKTKNTANTTRSLDQFRAEEERIEREFERKQQQQQDEKAQSDESADTPEQFDEKDAAKTQEIRGQILNASLAFVKTHGWSREALTHGAEALGYPGTMHGMFPNGAIELIQHFTSISNAALIAQLKTEVEAQRDTATTPSPKDFAIRAIRLRLEMIIPYKEHWPQALAIMTLPQNLHISLAHLLTLVDDICYCAGDRSVSIDWYTRRVGIASIYKMAELHLMQDNSIDHANTWKFLERRMDEALQIQEFLTVSDQKAQFVSKTLGSAFETARNILGINSDKK